MNESEQRQLNLGFVPAEIVDGLDYWADRDDLSRAQLARRILTGWLDARFVRERLEEQVVAAYERVRVADVDDDSEVSE
jgi:hypothetical protein